MLIQLFQKTGPFNGRLNGLFSQKYFINWFCVFREILTEERMSEMCIDQSEIRCSVKKWFSEQKIINVINSYIHNKKTEQMVLQIYYKGVIYDVSDILFHILLLHFA